jgi:hypothetical protein
VAGPGREAPRRTADRLDHFLNDIKVSL